jgi:hypothetical protein
LLSHRPILSALLSCSTWYAAIAIVIAVIVLLVVTDLGVRQQAVNVGEALSWQLSSLAASWPCGATADRIATRTGEPGWRCRSATGDGASPERTLRHIDAELHKLLDGEERRSNQTAARMLLIASVFGSILMLGFILGYGTRAAISHHRRHQARLMRWLSQY